MSKKRNGSSLHFNQKKYLDFIHNYDMQKYWKKHETIQLQLKSKSLVWDQEIYTNSGCQNQSANGENPNTSLLKMTRLHTSMPFLSPESPLKPNQ